MKKKCSRCGEEKEISCFWKDRRAKDGYSCRCKECSKYLWKKYYEQNKGYLLEKDRLRAIVDPEKERRRRKKYKSRPEVKEHYRIWWKEYSAKRIHSDELYSFRLWVIRETRRAAASKNGHVNPRLLPLLGCSGEVLWEHLLETWKKNYGNEWHGEAYQIDHIVPFATARTIEDIGKLAHYTNTQMLTPEDNRKKWTGNNSVLTRDKV